MRIKTNCIEAIKFTLIAALATLHSAPSLADQDIIEHSISASAAPEMFARLSIDPAAITVSGLSSGGFFAHQFHIAYSHRLSGAAIVAGGPFGCVDIIPNPFMPWTQLGSLAAAVVACTHTAGDRFWGLRPNPPQASHVADLVAEVFLAGQIDDPDHLKNDRVWLFHGSMDGVVSPRIGSVLAELYQGFILGHDALAIMSEDPDQPANHGMPIARSEFDSGLPAPECDVYSAPYIINCGFDATKLFLAHLYQEKFADTYADPYDMGSLLPFDQSPFFENGAEASLADTGYVYLPHDCLSNDCRLHVAFHGCQQSVQPVNGIATRDEFLHEAGYTQWAGGNRIVVFFPQVMATPSNPRGCWDFWGFTGPQWRTRDGLQMQAVAAMIDAIVGDDRNQ